LEHKDRIYGSLSLTKQDRLQEDNHIFKNSLRKNYKKI